MAMQQCKLPLVPAGGTAADCERTGMAAVGGGSSTCRSSGSIDRNCGCGGVRHRRQLRQHPHGRGRCGSGTAISTTVTVRQRRQQCRRHRRGAERPPSKKLLTTFTPTLLTSVVLVLAGFTVLFPRGAFSAEGAPSPAAAAAAASAAATAAARRHHRQRRQLQDSSTGATPECPSPLSDDDGVLAVSLPVDAAELAKSLAACTGGVYNVTWTGAVELAEPLVVAANSSVTITGAQGADGEAAALDGGGVTGLLDLGAGSSLRLESVILRNARRGAGNGGAIRAEAAGCSVAALGSTFEGNEAVSESGEGSGGALALGAGATARLENCTLSGNHAKRNGGGVWSDGVDSSLTLTDCQLKDNAAEHGGGVGMGSRSTAVFEGSTVLGNYAEFEGGGVYGVNATVVVAVGSEFVNNTMGLTGGGGISLHDESNLTISDSTFRRNYYAGNDSFSHASGGGVRVIGTSSPSRGATVSIVDSLFEDNYAPHGGGLWLSSVSLLTVARSVLHGNNASDFGGGASVESTEVAEFTACNFTESYAFNRAGGLELADSSVTISGCLFEGNSNRVEGGAISAEDNSVVTIKTCTFVNNFIVDGAGSGGAITVSGATLRATNCSFENNLADLTGTLYDAGTDPLEGGGAVMLENFSNATFVACNFSSNVGAYGGAILAEEASAATLTGVVMTDNEAGVYGGALSFHERSSCTMSDSRVGANTAGLGGGGLHFSNATVELDGVAFVGNSALGGSGGAILFTSGSNATVQGGRFVSNNASTSGGHVLATGADTLVNLLSSSSSGQGGDPQQENEEELQRSSSSSSSSFTSASVSASAAQQPLAFTGGRAGVNGGAVHASAGAVVTLTFAEMSGNQAAGGDGGAVGAHGARLVRVEDCNVTANSSGGNGGGVSVADAAFVGTSSSFTGNTAAFDGGGLRAHTGADVELQDCLVGGNAAQLGGGMSFIDAKLVAGRCLVTDNTASADGGGLRVSYQTTAVMDECVVSFNTADSDGGGVAVDASSGTSDDALFAANASSSFTCQGGGTFEGNEAGERGGAVYVTRNSDVTLDSCNTSRNAASLGASVYASHSFVSLRAGSVLAYDQVPTGAMVYALKTQLTANNTRFLALEDCPSILAVQTTEGSYMKALGCSFSGWEGAFVVLAAGKLEMDSCDFRGSQADVLVAAMNASSPARIRNTAVGIENYPSLASASYSSSTEGGATTTVLAVNVMSCASDDPCGIDNSSSSSSSRSSGGSGSNGVVGAVLTEGQRRSRRLETSSSIDKEGEGEEGAGFAERGCVDGILGVYCPCFIATITGEEECLEESTTLQLEAAADPLLAVGIQGTIETTLNVTAAGGAVVWEVGEVAGPFSEEAVIWTIVPNVGILEEGATATIAVTGRLDSDLYGMTKAQFKAESLLSGDSALAMVNTTFYYCIEGQYYLNDGKCLLCSDLDLGVEGLNCDEPGVLRATLPVAAGYWRSSNDTTVIRECLNDEACEGGAVIQDSDDYCALGYQGPYCAVCSPGHAGGISSRCHECTEAFRAGMIFLAVVGGVLAVAFLWLLLRFLLQDPTGSRSFLSCRSNRVASIVSRAKQLPLYKLKTPIVVFQILTQYAEITNVGFPVAFSKFLTFWNAVNLDVGWMLSASCIIAPDFYGRLLLVTLAPMALAAALGCTFLFARRRVTTSGLSKAHSAASNGMSASRQLSVIRRRHMAVLVTGTFLVYSTVSTTVFQTFACDTLDELKTTYLRADYSLMCNTAAHTSYRIYASVMILVYPIGIPLMYAWLLFRHHHRIYPKQALRDGVSPERRLADPKISHTVVLWQAYRPSRYYYEVIECARRLLLTGALVFILPDSAGQAGVACVLSVLTVCIFITLRPFSDPNDSHLYVLGCLLIFLSMFVSLVPKVAIADEDEQSQTFLSWLLIVLSMILWGMAFAQCFLEARWPTRKDAGRFDSLEASSAVNLMGSDCFSRRSGTGESNVSPKDRNLTPPDFHDFPHGNSGASRKSSGNNNGNGNLESGGMRVVEKGEYHNSVTAAAGQLHPSGYADPVMPRFDEGLHGSGAGWGNSSQGGGGEGGGGGRGMGADHAGLSNLSQTSGNTYGPLAAATVECGGGSSSRGSGSGGGNKFPPINLSDDDSAPDSPTMAEQMFLRRVGIGSGSGSRSGVSAGSNSGGNRKVRQTSGAGAAAAAAAQAAAAASATVYLDSPTMAEDMFARRLEGAGSSGGGSSTGSGSGGGSSRGRHPRGRGAGAAARSAVGAGTVGGTASGNAKAVFPGIDDYGDEEGVNEGGSGSGGGGGDSGGGGGGRGRYGMGSVGPLSQSPSSSLALRRGIGLAGGGSRNGVGGAGPGPGPLTQSPSSPLTLRPSAGGGGGAGNAGPLSPSPSSSLALRRSIGLGGVGSRNGVGSVGPGPLTQSPSSSLALRRSIGPGGVGSRNGVGSVGPGPLTQSPTSSLALRPSAGGGGEGRNGVVRSMGSLSPSPTSSLAPRPAPSPGGGSRHREKGGSEAVLSPAPSSSLSLLGPSPAASFELVVRSGQNPAEEESSVSRGDGFAREGKGAGDKWGVPEATCPTGDVE